MTGPASDARQVLAHLSAAGTSVLLIGDGGMPEIAYWGAALGTGPIDVASFERPVVGGGLDIDPPLGIVAETRRGWFGPPGIEGKRADGRDFAPRFHVTDLRADDRVCCVELADDVAALRLVLELTLDNFGVLGAHATITNTSNEAYELHALRLALPVGAQADELLTLSGRHAFEFAPTRTPWHATCLTVENRHGKTSHERVGAVFAGTTGFGEQHGEVLTSMVLSPPIDPKPSLRSPASGRHRRITLRRSASRGSMTNGCTAYCTYRWPANSSAARVYSRRGSLRRSWRPDASSPMQGSPPRSCCPRPACCCTSPSFTDPTSTAR